MAATLLTRSGVSRGLVALFQQPLQLTSLQQPICSPIHTSEDRAATAMAEAAPATETSKIRPFEEIPGPAPLPLIGNAWRFLPLIGDLHGLELTQLHVKIHDQYGKIARLSQLPGQPEMVFIYRPEDVETTYRNEGPSPIRGGMQALTHYRNVVKKDFYHDGIGVLTENGKRWLEARSKVNQPMMQPRVSRRYISPISDVAQDFIDRIRMLKDENDEMPPNFVNELFKWALESIAFIALDHRLGCLAPDLSPNSEPQKMIDAVSTFFDGWFHLEIGIPIWKIYPTPSWKKIAGAFDYFVDVSVKYIDKAIERVNERKALGNDDDEPSVLERLLARTDPKSACIMAQDMMFGGVDTTSYSTANVMYHLSKNPEKQEELFKEVKRVFPSRNDVVTEEKLEELRYLRACLKETARLTPIISTNVRTTVKETVLSNYRIPKGVMVFMPNILTLRNEEYFPMHDKFIPERWLKNRPTGDAVGSAEDYDAVLNENRNHFTFLPFGFGPRTCVGKRFAELEMNVLLSKMVRNFRLEYNYGEMRYLSEILTMPRDPLRFKMVERKD